MGCVKSGFGIFDFRFPSSLPPFLVFLADDVFKGCIGVVELFVCGVAGFFGAGGEGLAGEAGHGGFLAGGVGHVVGGVGGMDVHPRSSGDGVLTGTEEEELPGVFLGLVADALGDVGPGVAGGRVFLAIGKNGEGDVLGSVGRGERGEALAEAVDGAADSIEQGGAAVRDVGLGIERQGLGDGDGIDAGLDA